MAYGGGCKAELVDNTDTEYQDMELDFTVQGTTRAYRVTGVAILEPSGRVAAHQLRMHQ